MYSMGISIATTNRRPSNLFRLSTTSSSKSLNLSRLFVCLVLILLFSESRAGSADPHQWLSDTPVFLPVDEAFQFSYYIIDEKEIKIEWDIANSYYLYRDKFEFQLIDSEQSLLSKDLYNKVNLPRGENKYDEWFGDVEVFYDDISTTISLENTSNITGLLVSYQGCAEAGLCYPPQERLIFLPTAVDESSGVQSFKNAVPEIIESREVGYAEILSDRSLFLALFLFFLGGIALAFTPCVLPMVPIISTIILGQSDITRKRALVLSVFYVIGMSSAYSLIGAMVGLYGASLNIQGALQSFPVLVVFSSVFLVLSFSMFGLFELRVPQFLNSFFQRASWHFEGGGLAGVTLMGAASSLIVSPCITAPLAGALLYISSTGDGFMGALALFFLGIGMGVPLVIVGVGGSHFLPRTGRWMHEVKIIFGFMLLAVPVWLLERVFSDDVGFLMWLLLGLTFVFFLARIAWKYHLISRWLIGSITGFIVVLTILSFPIGNKSGFESISRLLLPEHSLGLSDGDAHIELDWETINNVAELSAKLQHSRLDERPILLDLYADWCVSCKIIERKVFSDRAVMSKMTAFRLLRVDVTENNKDQRELMSSFGIFGPPSILFFNMDGEELRSNRVMSEIGPSDMEARLDRILKLVVAE